MNKTYIGVSVTMYRNHPSLNYCLFFLSQGNWNFSKELDYEAGMYELRRAEHMLKARATCEINPLNESIVTYSIQGFIMPSEQKK